MLGCRTRAAALRESEHRRELATGEQRSVKEFVVATFAELRVELAFRGQGLDQVGVLSSLDAKRTGSS